MANSGRHQLDVRQRPRMAATARPRGTMSVGDFGQELRRLRTRAGLTLRSLAEQVSFDYSYLAQVERGTRTGSARLANRCDRALGAQGRLVRLYADWKAREPLNEDDDDA